MKRVALVLGLVLVFLQYGESALSDADDNFQQDTGLVNDRERRQYSNCKKFIITMACTN